MSSEWMKVMLDEIARKQAEAEQQRLELERRRAETAHRPAEPGAGGTEAETLRGAATERPA
jgi:hypothetical protein